MITKLDKQKVRKFISKNFYVLISLLIKLKFRTKIFKESPIIILTPGKVGSSSVYRSIRKQLTNPVFHVHSLQQCHVLNSIKFHKVNNISIPLHLIISKNLIKKLDSFDGKVYVISIVREPISRMISSYFQNIERYDQNYDFSQIAKTNEKAVKKLKNHLLDSVSYYDNWFETELKSNFGIDIYTDFKEKNDRTFYYKKDNISLLLMRMEDLNRDFSYCSKKFLRLKSEIKLLDSNLGSQKKYFEAYKMLKKELQVEASLNKKIRSTKFFKTFYY